jgi:hypothetical protein
MEALICASSSGNANRRVSSSSSLSPPLSSSSDSVLSTGLPVKSQASLLHAYDRGEQVIRAFGDVDPV